MMDVTGKYEAIVKKLLEAGQTVSTMESCTGGFVASCITDVEGASEVFHDGAVTYSNDAKVRHGVDEQVIQKYGVYSMETAHAMAKACMGNYHTDYGIGVTGVIGRSDPANPKGQKGIVYICVSSRSCRSLLRINVSGQDRHECKERVAYEAANLMLRQISGDFSATLPDD